jgi:catechol 2,3-dioxygenase-like lactoylglutathione lyase family enzyme
MAARAVLGIVTLGVDDLERSVAFYTALGLEPTTSSNEQIAWFRTPHSYVGLFGRDALAEDANVEPGGRTAFGGITLAINCPSEEDADALFARAIAAGARELKRPVRTEWGGYSGYFADPDGHPWEVARNPGFPIGEDGRLEIP